MSLPSIGDLAASLALRRQNAELKGQMARLTEELATGRTSDVTARVQADHMRLADIERNLTVLSSRATATQEVMITAGAMQTALERVMADTTALAHSALLADGLAGPGSVAAVAGEARQTLESVVTQFNTRTAGQTLFGGEKVRQSPLASADEIMNLARGAVAGAKNAAEVTQMLDSFFTAPTGGFDASVYRGATEERVPYVLGAGESVSLDVTAADPQIRDTLKRIVTAALAGDDTLPLSRTARQDLMRQAGEGLMSAGNAITGLRADLGLAEERISRAASRIAAESSGLQMARNDLLSVDPADTANELESTRFRLEALYTVAARSARLNLVSFLS